jgi:hypothetical protein
LFDWVDCDFWADCVDVDDDEELFDDDDEEPLPNWMELSLTWRTPNEFSVE